MTSKGKFVNKQDILDERLKAITEHPSYKLAYLDQDYIQSEELRPYRLALELLKPEQVMDERGIMSTIVVFGGTQVHPQEGVDELMAEAKAMISKDPDSSAAKLALLRAERRRTSQILQRVPRVFAHCNVV